MPDQTCGKPVGSNPGWMNRDQWEAIACRCIKPAGHQPPWEHECADHPGVK